MIRVKLSGQLGKGKTIQEKAKIIIKNFEAEGVTVSREDKDNKIILSLSDNDLKIKQMILEEKESE